MEGYTGEDEPPCIVMTFKDNSDKTTPPDLSLPVTLTGVREPRERLRIHRPAEGNVGLVTLKCITHVHYQQIFKLDEKTFIFNTFTL